MTANTKTIIITAIKADPSMTTSAKSRMIRTLTQPLMDEQPTIRFVTERQAATILGVSYRTIQRMKKDGSLPTHTVHGIRKIDVEAVYQI